MDNIQISLRNKLEECGIFKNGAKVTGVYKIEMSVEAGGNSEIILYFKENVGETERIIDRKENYIIDEAELEFNASRKIVPRKSRD